MVPRGGAGSGSRSPRYLPGSAANLVLQPAEQNPNVAPSWTWRWVSVFTVMPQTGSMRGACSDMSVATDGG